MSTAKSNSVFSSSLASSFLSSVETLSTSRFGYRFDVPSELIEASMLPGDPNDMVLWGGGGGGKSTGSSNTLSYIGDCCGSYGGGPVEGINSNAGGAEGVSDPACGVAKDAEGVEENIEADGLPADVEADGVAADEEAEPEDADADAIVADVDLAAADAAAADAAVDDAAAADEDDA